MACKRLSLKFAANLNFLFTEAGSSISERLKLAAKCGFPSVEIPYPADELNEVKSAKNETGIEVSLINIATDNNTDKLKFGSASIPGSEDLFKKQLLDTIGFAKSVNCKKIHIMAGTVSDEPQTKHLETYKSNLKIAAKLLEQEGIVGVIEPINKYAIPTYFLNSYEKALEVLKSVNSENIKLMVDVFHLQLIRGNVTNSLQEYKNQIAHIQIAQAPSRHEPDTSGELDFSYVFSKIADIGYSDYIGCEYKPKTTTAEGLKWIEKFSNKS